MHNETGFVNIVAKASGDFMREFTTAWRGGVPLAPTGPAAQVPAGTQPRPTAQARAQASAQAPAPTPSNFETRLAALESHVRMLEQARCSTIVNTHALHVLFDIVSTELDIKLPDFSKIVKTAMATIAEIQADLDTETISFEKLVTSSTYENRLKLNLGTIINTAAHPPQT